MYTLNIFSNIISKSLIESIIVGTDPRFVELCLNKEGASETLASQGLSCQPRLGGVGVEKICYDAVTSAIEDRLSRLGCGEPESVVIFAGEVPDTGCVIFTVHLPPDCAPLRTTNLKTFSAIVFPSPGKPEPFLFARLSPYNTNVPLERLTLTTKNEGWRNHIPPVNHR